MTENSKTGVPLALNQQLTQIYNTLFNCYGPQHWWPGDSPFEVIVGAILTQSAAWINVEKAINNLKEADVLNPVSLRQLPHEKLAELVYSSGYFNAKARKLKAFVEHLRREHRDSLESLFSSDITQLRTELLSLYGIGPETADSIILYAAQKSIFVIDAFTIRILNRLGISTSQSDYHKYQALFMENLPHDEQMFNEYHALLVRHGKEVCKKKPLCNQCCLSKFCLYI